MKKRRVSAVIIVLSIMMLLCCEAFGDDGSVFFEGKALQGGIRLINETEYADLAEIADAEGFQLRHETGSAEFSFDWRLGTAVLKAGSDVVNYLGEKRILETAALSDGTDGLLVPVSSFCEALEIGTYYDAEFSNLYCTAGAGDWELPGGYNVAVMMYHATGHADAGSNLVMPPESLDDQLKYITENGYTTIGFEDLWNVADISKPVILVFDDGWSNNYSYLPGLLEKYDCKATIAVVEKFTDEGSHIHMTSAEVKELSDSGRISIQSHTVTHRELGLLSAEEQEYEMSESKLFITRLTGKEPFVLVYPTGSQNNTTLEVMTDYYRFGVKMLGRVYNTDSDPRLVFRFFPENNTYINVYANWLRSAFPEAKEE